MSTTLAIFGYRHIHRFSHVAAVLSGVVFTGLFVMLGIGGVLFPLTGLSLLVMIALDLIWQWSTNRRRPDLAV